MSRSTKQDAKEQQMEDSLEEKEKEGSSAVKLALDTLDRLLNDVRKHRRPLRTSDSRPNLAAVKK